MRLHKPAILVALLFAMLVGGLPTRAQLQLVRTFPQTPLLVGIRNDLGFGADIWALEGSFMVQRTTYGHDYVPIVSPPGDSVAFQQMPAAYLDQRSVNANQLAPKDIYVMNLSTSKAVAAATQLKNISFAEGQARYILRSDPTWSPDGKLLAWTEIATDQTAGQNVDLKDERLMVYSVATKTARIAIPKLPAHRIVGQYPLLSEVSLGPHGLIVVKTSVSHDLDPSDQDWLFVYDMNGKQLAKVKGLETSDPAYQYGQLIWLSGFDTPYVSCVVCKTKINPSTGAIDNLAGPLELYSALAPNKLSFYYGADSGNEANVTWIIALNGKQVSKFDSVRISSLSDMAISPDGMQIAGATYSGQGTTAGVFLYQAQNNSTISVRVNVIGLGWGPMAWRVHHSR